MEYLVSLHVLCQAHTKRNRNTDHFVLILVAHYFKFDFENGTLRNWRVYDEGTAFANQPVYGDNPKAREKQAANPQGKWSINTYENRNAPSKRAEHYQGMIILIVHQQLK